MSDETAALGGALVVAAILSSIILAVFLFRSEVSEGRERKRLYDECASCETVVEQRMCAAHHWSSNYIINHCVQREDRVKP